MNKVPKLKQLAEELKQHSKTGQVVHRMEENTVLFSELNTIGLKHFFHCLCSCAARKMQNPDIKR